MKVVNWDAVNTAGMASIPVAGGYVAVITAVKDYEEKECLRVEWDYARPPYMGANAATMKRAKFWPTAMVQSYRQKALPYFKRFKSALEQSNFRYVFDENDLEAMVGLEIGVILGEEEYLKNNGTVGRRVYVHGTTTVQAIEEGDFRLPPFKPLKNVPLASLHTEPVFECLDDTGELLPF